ncbi:MAG: type VI secretion system tip protein TssI/VgrG [Byssovorax sp.]
MSILELSFASGESTLSVRKFTVRDTMSGLFSVAIQARCPNDDIDLESIVGKPSMFRVVSGLAGAHAEMRSWSGVCSEMELIRVESSGLSTYALTIVPNLWMLTQRSDHRMFQHMSVPEIVSKVLRGWEIRHELRLEREAYPRLELRVQYGESDYAFVSRLLEEAGISFYFEDDLLDGSQLVLHDRPQINDPRESPPLPFIDEPSAQAADREHVTAVRVKNHVRPGKITIRDFDFRRPGFALYGESPAHAGVDARMEQYHYHPGAFLTEGHKGGDTPTADDRGVARFHHAAGHRAASQRLEGHRASKQLVHFKTNAIDLAPGVVFSIGSHPRRDLAPEKKLLVTSFTFEGEVGKEWETHCTAHHAELAYRPAATAVKPRIYGVQSAIVVGPKSEEVHTDEFGRVRVQFHWDREGRFDDNSSAWIRVSQAWAGPGYGMVNLPRVGHEVLVSFLEGDPDHPIITGRVFNGAAQVPYKLPDSKMWSTWKSDSNSNIILYVDIPGSEGFCEQAERDRLNVVKHDVFTLIGNDDTTAIHGEEAHVTGGAYQRGVVGEHSTITGGEYSVVAKHTLSQTAGLELTMVSGFKWEASVTPLVPLVLATLAVNVIRSKVADAFPAGPPDLLAILQAQAAAKGWNPNMGLPPGVSVVMALPVDAKADIDNLIADFKGLFVGVLQPLLKLLGSVSPQVLQAILQQLAQAPDLATLIQIIESAFPPPPPGGTSISQLLGDLQGLFGKLMASLPDPNPAPGSQAPIQQVNPTEVLLNKLKPVLAMFSEIMDEISPGNSIRIQPSEIRITTGKATIELKGDDIEIKAKGKITIEGAEVCISPMPT